MRIHETAIIYADVIYGSEIIIEPYAILGIQDRFHEKSQLIIGDRAFIGSRCTVYAGVKVGDDFDISDQSTIFFDNIFGNHCRIGPKAIIKNGCKLGDHVRINAGVFLERVIGGSHIFIGPGTTFADDKHPPCPRYADCVPTTEIGSYVSIGANVIVAPGIKIGSHCQIYAGAVVTKNVESFSVVAGHPAKKIKEISDLTCTSGLYERPFEWWMDKNTNI